MKVIKNYLYNASYQILLMLAPLLTTPYVARILGAHANGINTYTNGWVTFFCLFGQLGVGLYGNREIAYCQRSLKERSQAFWEIWSIQLAASVISLAAYLFAVMVFSSTFKYFFLLQSLYIIGGALDISWYFMGIEDFKKIVVRNACVKLISIGLIFLLVRSPHDLSKYIFLLGGSSLLGTLSLWPYLRGQIKLVPLHDLHPFQHLYPTILLFIPTITTQIYLVVNRIMLGRMSTQDAVSQFDFGDKMIKLALSLVTAVGTVMLPHIANKFAEGDQASVHRTLVKSFDFCTALAVPIMFGLMAISAKFAPWFLGSEYGPTSKVIFYEAPVVVFIAWSNVTGTQYLMPIHREKAFTFSVTVGAIVNVLANVLLIPKYGVSGAATATVISEASVCVAQLILMRDSFKIQRLFAALWKYLLAGGVMYLVVTRLNEIMRMTLANLAAQIILGITVYSVIIWLLKPPIIKSLNETAMPVIKSKLLGRKQ